MYRKSVLSFLVIFWSISPLYSSYPQILRLHKSDPYYTQLQYDIGEYYKRHLAGKSSNPINIYTYKIGENDSLFTVCSVLNLSYDTIASINGFNNPADFETKESILIPSVPGLYINQSPLNGFEQMLNQRENDGKKLIIHRPEGKMTYTFLESESLNGQERSFFLKTLFRKPLSNSMVTSDFGYRIHPVFGNRHFHTGIDYRASVGTDVYSSLDGIISRTGVLGNYGLYIIIEHDGGYETVYSHLDKVFVKVNDRVIAGQIIGTSGNTGISTGPHLHFEIRKDGIPLDPSGFFPGE